MVMFFHLKEVSQGRWPEVESNMGPRDLCLCEEEWLSRSESAARLSPKLPQGFEGELAFLDLP